MPGVDPEYVPTAGVNRKRAVSRRVVHQGAAIGEQVRKVMHNWMLDFRAREKRKPSPKEMMEHFDRSLNFCSKIFDGELVPKDHAGGTERMLKSYHLTALHELALTQPFKTLSWYAQQLYSQFPAVSVGGLEGVPSSPTMSRALRGMGLSLQARRALCAGRLDGDIEMYVFTFLMKASEFGVDVAWFDASGVNRDTGVRSAGWAQVGSGGCGANSEEHGANITVLGMMDRAGYFMHRSYEGSTDLQRIVQYFIEAGPDLVERGIKCVILDNASVQGVGFISALMAGLGIHVLYLPNYHPDFNPVSVVVVVVREARAMPASS